MFPEMEVIERAERDERTSMITIRLPARLHRELKTLAHRCEISMNEMLVGFCEAVAERGEAFARELASVRREMEGAKC